MPVAGADNTEVTCSDPSQQQYTGTVAGGMEENMFRAIATAVGRHLAQQKEGEYNPRPEGAQMKEVVTGVVGLGQEHKQTFADICISMPAWHKLALSLIEKEIEKQDNAFLVQDGKRIKYSEGAKEGLNKGISPSRSLSEVSADKNSAEASGCTTCGSIKDLLSTADAGDEITSYQWLMGACQIDESVRYKVGDPNYVGPEGLEWTLVELFEQISAVRQLYESDGTLLQPPNILLREQAKCGVLAKVEQWWVAKWAQMESMPERSERGLLMKDDQTSGTPRGAMPEKKQ